MNCLKKAILLILGIITILTSYPQGMLISSGENFKEVQYEIVDKKYKSQNNYLVIDVIIPQINKVSADSKLGMINSKIVKWTETWINDVKQIADEYFKGVTPPIGPYQLFARYNVVNKQDITSFYIDYYQFTGGAHGITTRMSYNFDNVTGKELTIKDLFKKGYDYKTVINNEISNQIQKEKEKYFTGKDGFNGIKDTQGFYIKDGNIVIYYQVYEIAPYVTGIPEFYIPVNKFPREKLNYEIKPYIINSAIM